MDQWGSVKLNCKRCHHEYSYYVPSEKKYCSFCIKFNELEKKDKEKDLKIQELESENKSLKDNYQSDLEKEKDNHHETMNDFIDKSQEWHQRQLEEKDAIIAKLNSKLKELGLEEELEKTISLIEQSKESDIYE